MSLMGWYKLNQVIVPITVVLAVIVLLDLELDQNSLLHLICGYQFGKCILFYACQEKGSKVIQNNMGQITFAFIIFISSDLSYSIVQRDFDHLDFSQKIMLVHHIVSMVLIRQVHTRRKKSYIDLMKFLGGVRSRACLDSPSRLLQFVFPTTKNEAQCLVRIFEIWKYHILYLEILFCPIYWMIQAAASLGWVQGKKQLCSRFMLQHERLYCLGHVIQQI